MKKKKKNYRLTEKQEHFAIEYVRNGGSGTNAYKEVYKPKTEDMSHIYSMASRVRNNVKVSSRIHALRLENWGNDILSIAERKIILSNLGLHGDIKSIDILNKMENVYIEKHEDISPQPTTVIYNVLPKKK